MVFSDFTCKFTIFNWKVSNFKWRFSNFKWKFLIFRISIAIFRNSIEEFRILNEDFRNSNNNFEFLKMSLKITKILSLNGDTKSTRFKGMLKALLDTIRYGYWILKLYLVQLMDVLFTIINYLIWSKTRLQICKRPWSSLILSSREGRTFPQKFISIFSHVVLHQRFYLFFNFSRKPSFLITFFSCTSFLVFLLPSSAIDETETAAATADWVEKYLLFYNIVSS